MRVFKIVGGLLAGLALFLVILTGVVAIAGPRLFAWVIEHPVSRYVGREIKVGRPLSITWSDPLRIVAQDVRIANAAWGSRPDMLVAERVEIVLSPWTLVSSSRHFPLIALNHAFVLIETSRQNQTNWDVARSAIAPSGNRPFPELNRIVVRDGTFMFRNGATGAEATIAAAALDIEAPDPTGPVTLAVGGTLRQQPLRLDGTIGPLAELRDPSRPYPIDLRVAIGESRLSAHGTLAKPLAFTGVDLQLSAAGGATLDDLAGALELPLPRLENFRASGQLAGGGGAWQVKALTLGLGQSDLAGSLDIDNDAEVPRLRATLTSNLLNFAEVAGVMRDEPSGSTAPPSTRPAKASTRIIPETPLTLGLLPEIAVDLTYDGSRIAKSEGLPLERVTLSMQRKNGALVVPPATLGLAGGEVRFGLTLDTAQPPRLTLDLEVRHIDLQQLVAGAPIPAAFRETRGIAGGFVHVQSTGATLRDMLGHMNGDAGLFTEKGQFNALLAEITAPNVLEAIGLVEKDHRPVPVNCLVSRFDIRNGVATATTLLLDTPETTLTGAGNFNLAAETLYLDFTPHHKYFNPLTMRAPFGLRGTFAEPQFQIDKTGVIQRLGAAIGLGILAPPAALLPLIDTGLGEGNACSRAYTAQKTPEPASGSNLPQPKKAR